MERSYFGKRPLLERTRQAPRLNIRIGLGSDSNDEEESPFVRGRNNTIGRRIRNGGLAGTEFRPENQPGKITRRPPKIVQKGRETTKPSIKVGPKKADRQDPEELIKKRRFAALQRRLHVSRSRA